MCVEFYFKNLKYFCVQCKKIYFFRFRTYLLEYFFKKYKNIADIRIYLDRIIIYENCRNLSAEELY